jgi:hypothetical protein
VQGAQGRVRSMLLLLFFALYFYRMGAANVEALLNYPFWRDMGAMMANADFIQLRADHIWKIFPIMVAPIGLLVLVTAALSAMGAPPVPRWVFLGALVLQAIAVVSTLAIQLPIQLRLDTQGYDAAAIDRLIATDLLFRKLPGLIEGVLVVFALWKVIAAARTHASAAASRRREPLR